MTKSDSTKQLSDKEMIEKLVEAIQVLIDTPTGGPRSVGTWKAAEAQGRDAILMAQSR